MQIGTVNPTLLKGGQDSPDGSIYTLMTCRCVPATGVTSITISAENCSRGAAFSLKLCFDFYQNRPGVGFTKYNI